MRCSCNKPPPRLPVLSVRFPTFMSEICSGMWEEWLPFSLNWYAKYASVWYVIRFVLKPSLFLCSWACEWVNSFGHLVICKPNSSLCLSPTDWWDDLCADITVRDFLLLTALRHSWTTHWSCDQRPCDALHGSFHARSVGSSLVAKRNEWAAAF